MRVVAAADRSPLDPLVEDVGEPVHRVHQLAGADPAVAVHQRLAVAVAVGGEGVEQLLDVAVQAPAVRDRAVRDSAVRDSAVQDVLVQTGGHLGSPPVGIVV